MTDRRAYRIRRDNPSAQYVASSAAQEIMRLSELNKEFDVDISEPQRTLDANACMWATLADIAAQVKWAHTHQWRWRFDLMPSASWKAVLTAAYEQETAMAEGVNGGTVMMGARTSKYSRRRMGEFLEFVHAFGAGKGVRWSDKARDELAEFSRAKA